MILVLLLSAEAAFWVLVLGGLVLRYVAGARLLGGALLLCTPHVDVVLTTLIVLDLRSGAAPHWSHGLGAVYLAFTLLYGRRTVAWVDRRSAARRAGAAQPRRIELHGRAHLAQQLRDTLRFLVAAALAGVLLLVCAGLAAVARRPRRSSCGSPRSCSRRRSRSSGRSVARSGRAASPSTDPHPRSAEPADVPPARRTSQAGVVASAPWPR